MAHTDTHTALPAIITYYTHYTRSAVQKVKQQPMIEEALFRFATRRQLHATRYLGSTYGVERVAVLAVVEEGTARQLP